MFYPLTVLLFVVFADGVGINPSQTAGEIRCCNCIENLLSQEPKLQANAAVYSRIIYLSDHLIGLNSGPITAHALGYFFIQPALLACGIFRLITTVRSSCLLYYG